MKFIINRFRALVFLVAALGYLPLQSAEHSYTQNYSENASTDVKKDKLNKNLEKKEAAKRRPLSKKNHN